jgi:hypothetical protein
MGCSHSVREEKHIIRPKKSKGAKEDVLSLESKVAKNPNKIALKSIGN